MTGNIFQTTKRFRDLYKVGKRLLLFSYRTDKKTTLSYYLSAIIGSIMPIIVMVTYQYLLDELVVVETNSLAIIPIAVIALLGLRYLLITIEDILIWAYNRGYLDYLMRYKLQNEITLQFSAKVINLDIPHIENSTIQDKVTKTRNTAMWRMTDFLRDLMYFIETITRVVSSFIVLVPFGWWIPFILAIVSLPRLYLRSKHGILQWSIYSANTKENKKLWYLNWILSDPDVIRESKIFKSQNRLINRYNSLQKELLAKQMIILRNEIKILTYPSIYEAITLFAITLLFLPNLTSGVLTLGRFTLLVSLIERFSSSVGGITDSLGRLFENQFFVEQFFEIMDLEPVIPVSSTPVDLGEINPPRIEFRNVSFTYPNEKTPALHNVSFAIEPGESVAFVGANGAGKSTIVKLLCRFYDVDSGTILINGVNIKDVAPSQWYEFISTLFQEFVQYHFSVSENITMGTNANPDIEKIKNAAQKSGAAEFIDHLEHSYDQILGKEYADGTELSTGQWQKLAIARAFYEEAPVLILDEPTSAVDATAEHEIFENLLSSYGNKTLIFVSHRFSTVRHADRIFVVEKGRITESGTHEQLLAANTTYANMFALQAEGYR